MKTICEIKLANAFKYQDRQLTMDDKRNRIFGTDFIHWAIVRKVKAIYKRPVSMTEVDNWLKSAQARA